MLQRAAEIEFDLAHEELDDYDRVILETELNDLHLEMEQKVDNIDDFMLDLDKQQALIQAELDVINKEAERLRRKRTSIEKTQSYFDKNLLPRIIERFGNGHEYKTDTRTYRFATKHSKLIVDDPALIAEEYLIPQPPKVDGRKARADAIKACKEGLEIAGFHVYEERYVKKS